MQKEMPAWVSDRNSEPRGRLAWVMGGITITLSALMLAQAVRNVVAPADVPATTTASADGPSVAAARPTMPASSEPVAVPPPAATVAEPIVRSSAGASEPQPQSALLTENRVSSTPEKPAPAQSVAPSASKKWLQGLPAGSLMVVHARMPTVQEVERWRSSRPLLANARVLQSVPQNGREPRYLLVTGPFRSAERAHNYMQRLDWKAGAASLSREELLPMTR